LFDYLFARLFVCAAATIGVIYCLCRPLKTKSDRKHRQWNLPVHCLYDDETGLQQQQQQQQLQSNRASRDVRQRSASESERLD
jgi:hypothetical protein